jgi:signal transduction histidine kinase
MNLNFIVHLIAALVVIIFSLFVFIKNRSNIHFAVFGTTIFIWLFASSIAYASQAEQQALFWFKISYIGIIFIAATFYSFIFNLLGKRQNKIIFLNYAISLFFVFLLFYSEYLINGLYKYSWGYYPKASTVAHPIFLLFFNLLFIIAITSVFLSLWSKTGRLSASAKNRLKYVSIGSIFGTFGDWDFLPNYGINIYPYGFIFMVILVAIYSYAIIRYRFMDINVVFKKTLVYSLSAGLLMGLFIVLALLMTEFVSALSGTKYSFNVSKITIISAFIIALLFSPLRNKIQNLIDKLFYKKTYDYYSTIQKVSHDLAAMFDFKKIYSFVGDIIFSTLGLKSIYLLSAVPSGDYKAVFHRSHGSERSEVRGEGGLKIDRDSEIIKLLKTSNDIIITDELSGIKEILGQEIIENITNTLKSFNGQAVLPVFIDDKLQLLMILGEKLSGDIFTEEDIKLLSTISYQTAIALKNVRLYEEKFRAEKFASIGMMSATFAHEIRNPLTSVKTFAGLFPEKYNDAEFRDTFSKIVVNDVKRIDGLIADLLSFSSGRALSCTDRVNITALIDETLENLKGTLGLERRNISLAKSYKTPEINITCDSKMLRQAFINIITNSCEAVDENGALTVQVTLNGRGDVDIIIADTGNGISPEDINRIFDPFYTTKPMGMGLGLAISKKIIEDHDGRITVESDLSKGTTFKISLPMKEK